MIIKKGVSLNISSPNVNSVVLNKAESELRYYFYQIFEKGSSLINITLMLEPTENLEHDGFMLDITESGIIISSNMERGVLYGVYELLKLLGCRFIFPRKSTEVIPSHDLLELKNQTIIKNPLIEMRGMCLYELSAKTLPEALDCIDYMAKNYYNMILTSINREDDTDGFCHAILFKEIEHELLPALTERGFVIDMSEHSTDCFFPRKELFAEHPEWFSLQNSKRVAGQICYSNKEAVAKYIEKFVEYVKSNHSFNIIGTWPLDGGGYCQCEGCKDPLRIYKVVCEIANAIAEVRPDLTVEHLAYTPQSFTRPTEPMPKNLSVLVCSVKDNVAYEWGKCAQNSGGAYYFDYSTADNYRYRANTIINPFYIDTMVNTFATYKYKGIVSLYLPITAWWQAGINYSLLSESYYNPFEPVENRLEAISQAIFGIDNASLLKQALYLTVSRLQSKLLWSGHPHKHTYMPIHTDNRAEKLDELHLKSFNDIYEQITDLIGKADLSVMNAFQKQQLEYFKAYLKLQKIYFTDIDMFNSKTQDEKQADRYLNELKALEERFGKVFISENYARWRIIGRDNILKKSETQNNFEANVKTGK